MGFSFFTASRDTARTCCSEAWDPPSIQVEIAVVPIARLDPVSSELDCSNLSVVSHEWRSFYWIWCSIARVGIPVGVEYVVDDVIQCLYELA